MRANSLRGCDPTRSSMAMAAITSASSPPLLPLSSRSITSARHLRQLHALAVKTGATSDHLAMAPLIAYCALSPCATLLSYAHLLLRRIPCPDLPLFNVLIRAHATHSPGPSSALTLFADLLDLGLRPDHLTFPFLLKACAKVTAVSAGQTVHGFAVKSGLSFDCFIETNLLQMYCDFGLLEAAEMMFDRMRNRDVVAVTTMVVGFARGGMVDRARKLFDDIPERDPASWSAMVTAYVQCGRFAEGIGLFDDMRRQNVHLTEAGAVSALTACAHLGSLERGEWIHGYVNQRGFIPNPILDTALVDMYAKCGKIEGAMDVFNKMQGKNLISWTVMIKALAAHGLDADSLNCLRKMQSSGIEPDGTVFVGILSACAHAGLVEEGRECFLSIPSPRLDHYACMVDLLGRAGLFKELEELLERMTPEPDGAIWGSVLNACKIHGNIELGERAGQELMRLGTDDGGHFVLLANLYASCGRWSDALKVRRMMGRESIERLPGWSSIEINGSTHTFVAGDRSHPETQLIHAKLYETVTKVRSAGYREDLRGCILDVDDDEKSRCLLQHSEKLALAFGLISTEAGETLYIMKNLRVCCDCHSFMKLASLVLERKIVMRDRNRFHHFSGGSCSCTDYW